MGELLALLGSEFLCKTHIFNFKSAVSQPIRGFNIWGISKKIRKTQKLSKISKMSKVIS
jgi:hypothetical protein